MSGENEEIDKGTFNGHDSIVSLPLSAFKLEHASLQKATLRKNIALETVIDFTETDKRDVGLISPKELMLHFERDEISDAD